MSLHITTFSTSPEKSQFLFESAKLHGLTVENLASKPWSGWQDKIDPIVPKLESLPDTDIFCFIDSYDLLINADKDTIISTFKSFDKPIVFGAEANLFPPCLRQKEGIYPESPTPFRFLNSGVFIGYVGAIKKIFEWGKLNYKFPLGDETDQGFYGTYFLENPGAIELDRHAKIGLNMVQVPWNSLVIEGGRAIFTPFNTAPCFLHFNGMSYMDRDTDFIDLGEGKKGFDYHKVYSRTFLALLGAKFVSRNSPVRSVLTSHGHTYS